MYMTAKEAGEKWGVSERRVRVLCTGGRIEGAFLINGTWCIPAEAQKPSDARRRGAMVLTMSEALRRGLDNGEFFAVYQPQYDISTGLVTGAEVLARWNCPVMGERQPAAFIPAMESSGLIVRLDAYIFREACRFLRRALDAGLCPVPLSVNLSRDDVFCPSFIDELEEIRLENNIDPSLLRIEITESVAIKGSEAVYNVVCRLHELGYLVEIDDFGSGFSSLNILREIPFDVIKLDQSLLSGGMSGRGAIILSSVIRMAKWLKMPIIAEGVETREQADYLRSAGCTVVQGYYYARPLYEEAYAALLGPGHNVPPTATPPEPGILPADFWNPGSEASYFFEHFAGPSVIFSWDTNSRRYEILRVNRAFAEALGMNYSEADVVSLDAAVTLVPASREQMRLKLEEAASTLKPVTLDAEHLFSSRGCGEDTVFMRYHIRLAARRGFEGVFFANAENVTPEKQGRDKNTAMRKKLFYWAYDVATKQMHPCARCMWEFGLPALVENYPEPVLKLGIFPPDYADLYRGWHRQIEEGVPSLEAVIPLTEARVPFLVRYTTEFDAAGRPVRAYGSATEATETVSR